MQAVRSLFALDDKSGPASITSITRLPITKFLNRGETAVVYKEKKISKLPKQPTVALIFSPKLEYRDCALNIFVHQFTYFRNYHCAEVWMAALKPGETAPEFELPAVTGKQKHIFKLSDYRSKKNVVLAFYPLDWSPT